MAPNGPGPDALNDKWWINKQIISTDQKTTSI